MADADHYPGLVALITSLRMHSQVQSITVLDLGLSPWQRAELEPSCSVVQLDVARERHPFYLSAFAGLLDPDGLVFCVDADVIVTGSLAPLMAAAENGKVCVGVDRLAGRWFAEWETIFDLPAAPRRQTYSNSGAALFSTRRHPQLLRRWSECCDRIVEPPPFQWKGLDHPFALPDQDALNALLMSEVDADAVEVLPPAIFANGPEMDGVVVHDAARLECTKRGQRTLLLHAFGDPKPWQPAAARDLTPTPYLECLRVLMARAADPAAPAPHVDASSLPRWLRPTAMGIVTRAVLFTRSRVAREWRRVQRRMGRRELA